MMQLVAYSVALAVASIAAAVTVLGAGLLFGRLSILRNPGKSAAEGVAIESGAGFSGSAWWLCTGVARSFVAVGSVRLVHALMSYTSSWQSPVLVAGLLICWDAWWVSLGRRASIVIGDHIRLVMGRVVAHRVIGDIIGSAAGAIVFYRLLKG